MEKLNCLLNYLTQQFMTAFPSCWIFISFHFSSLNFLQVFDIEDKEPFPACFLSEAHAHSYVGMTPSEREREKKVFFLVLSPEKVTDERTEKEKEREKSKKVSWVLSFFLPLPLRSFFLSSFSSSQTRSFFSMPSSADFPCFSPLFQTTRWAVVVWSCSRKCFTYFYRAFRK